MTTSAQGSGYRTMGVIATVIGLGLCAWGLAFDPSIEVQGVTQNFGYGITLPGLPERVVNTGEAVKKMMIFSSGGFLTLAGLILGAAGRIIGILTERPSRPVSAFASDVSTASGDTVADETQAGVVSAPPKADESLMDRYGPLIILGVIAVFAVFIAAWMGNRETGSGGDSYSSAAATAASDADAAAATAADAAATADAAAADAIAAANGH